MPQHTTRGASRHLCVTSLAPCRTPTSLGDTSQPHYNVTSVSVARFPWHRPRARRHQALLAECPAAVRAGKAFLVSPPGSSVFEQTPQTKDPKSQRIEQTSPKTHTIPTKKTTTANTKTTTRNTSIDEGFAQPGPEFPHRSQVRLCHECATQLHLDGLGRSSRQQQHARVRVRSNVAAHT